LSQRAFDGVGAEVRLSMDAKTLKRHIFLDTAHVRPLAARCINVVGNFKKSSPTIGRFP